MDRRHWLGLVGSGVGLSLGQRTQAADGHGPDDKENGKADGGMMAPAHALHLHFCGIHIAKSNPKFQLITQHYCMARSNEMHQCLLYESCEKNAKLIGVEYIVSDRIYRELPDAEKKYWHPHTYEVLAGGLIAPSMKPDDEQAFMKALLTTWGKTWHTWPDPTTAVPMGDPLLMWAVTGDGQLDEQVIATRDKQFKVSVTRYPRAAVPGNRLRGPESIPATVDRPGRPPVDR